MATSSPAVGEWVGGKQVRSGKEGGSGRKQRQRGAAGRYGSLRSRNQGMVGVLPVSRLRAWRTEPKVPAWEVRRVRAWYAGAALGSLGRLEFGVTLTLTQLLEALILLRKLFLLAHGALPAAAQGGLGRQCDALRCQPKGESRGRNQNCTAMTICVSRKKSPSPRLG